MSSKWMKVILPIVVLATCVGVFTLITSAAKEPDDKKAVDTRPNVSIENIVAVNHQVIITSYGEIKPLESTLLAAQVSGEVVQWNPNFIAGGFVKRGDVLFRIESDNYVAQVLEREAALSQAKATLIKEQADAKVAADEAKRSPHLNHSDLYLRKPQVLSAKASVKSAEAGLKRARRDLARCQVKAPYDALVISKNIGLGQFVSVGAQVAVINNVETAEVTIPIAGFDSAFLPSRVNGIKATVVQKSFDSFTREAIISRDLGVVDSSTRMSNLVVRIEDPYGLKSNVRPLKFGSYVEVNFHGQTLNGVYRLPQELVNNNIVWVVNDKGELESRQVKVIREDGEFFLINDGLIDQDKLVVTLPEYPQQGLPVNVTNSGAETEITRL